MKWKAFLKHLANTVLTAIATYFASKGGVL